MGELQQRVQKVADELVDSGAERGLQVAELWPEFAANGKQAVTVRHVLDHTAGVPGIPLDTFGVGGVGGSFAFGDTAFGLAKNRVSNDFATASRLTQLVAGAA